MNNITLYIKLMKTFLVQVTKTDNTANRVTKLKLNMLLLFKQGCWVRTSPCFAFLAFPLSFRVVWVLRNRRGRSNPSLVPVGKGKGKEATLCEAREGGRGKANKGKTRKEAAPASIIYLKARKA
jgi:hypothetical protein